MNVGTHNYTRNKAGTITADSTYAAGVATDTQCYGYDALQELTAAWTPSSNDCSTAPSSTSLGGPAPYWTSYGIDTATGNRTSVTQNPTSGTGTTATDTYAYPAGGSSQPHAVQSITHATGGTSSTDTYGYDASGNTTTRPGQTLTWNAVGKPDSVTIGAGTQRNVYDASGGLLLEVEPDGSATLFNGDTELHVAAGSSTVTAVRTYASPDGVPVAERTTAAGVTGSKLFWVSANVDGSVDVEVDAGSGTVSRRYTDPYGNARGPAVSWSDAHGFLNKPVSAATGLTTVGARLYDPVLGRFVSVDSVLAPTNPQQNNGYSYSANNPVTLADPSGGCWVGSSDAFNFKSNCSTGIGQPITHGVNAPGADKTVFAGTKSNRPPTSPGGKPATTVPIVIPPSVATPMDGLLLGRLLGAGSALSLVLMMGGDSARGRARDVSQDATPADPGGLCPPGRDLGPLGSCVPSSEPSEPPRSSNSGTEIQGKAGEYDLEELAEFANGHAGDGWADGLARPGSEQILKVLQQGTRTRIPGRNAIKFEMNIGPRVVRVIVNEDSPFRSTAFYPDAASH